ncbi:MAG: pyridoxal-dependent decarboxylase, partial [Rhodobacteraceae bacterium]|nr:pyridoxal-dependent decarboxylase [Paracoccaceae bacterium]
MKYSDIPKWSGEAAKWAEEYFSNLDDQPVRSQVEPGDIKALLPANPPENPEDMEIIFKDFKEIIPQGITHWQHPRFFAYFVSNASPASIIAEQLVNYMATNSMLWQTSPAATELEERMIQWFGHAFGLQSGYSGLIQDTASSTTLAAVLTMREKALNWEGLDRGLRHSPHLRIYGSKENHSSIEKAVKLSGIGFDNLRFPNNLPNRS